MEKIYCPYCGERLENGCSCEAEAAEYAEQRIEELEERQRKSGLYAFQDLMEMYTVMRDERRKGR